MTYTEIIKALGKNMDLIDLIERQQAEIDNLTHTLLGVMHSVDKWLDGAELEQDEVNRAATMREKTLRIVEEKQAEIERLTINMNAFGLSAIREKERADTARAEAIKEFADKAKEKMRDFAKVDFSR